MRIRLLLPVLFLGLALQAQTPAIQWLKKKGPVGGEILEIEVDPATGNIFLLDGDNRPYRSEDAGLTWTKVSYSASSDDYIYDIEITNGTIFLVASYELYASVNGGDSFVKRMSTASPYDNVRRLKRMPTSGKLVALSYNTVFTSDNDGVTWTPAGNVDDIDQGYHLEVNEVDQIFILRQNAQFEVRPFKSINSGGSFTEMSTGIPAGHHVNSLTAENDGANLYCTTAEGIFKSDGIGAWTSIKTAAISDVTTSEVHPGNSYVEFSADGLGMFFVDNVNHKLYSKGLADTDWALRSPDFPSDNLMATCAAAVNYPGAATAVAYFGSPSGVFKTITGGASLSEVNTGIASVKAEQVLADFSYLYLRTYLPNSGTYELMRSQDQGNNWTKLADAPDPVGLLTKTEQALFAIDVGTLYRSFDNGLSWFALAPPPGGFTWAGGTGPDKVFGLTGSSFYYSANNGNTWTASALVISGMPASAYIYESSICFASPGRMFVKVYDYDLPGESFYRIDFTYNASEVITSALATKITTLPIPATDVYQMAAANGKFFAYQTFGTNPNRVAVSADGGVTWTTRSVPEADDMFVVKNGYIFLADNSTADKLYISRDDGATFTETIWPASAEIAYLADITLDNSGYAYMAFNGDYLYHSANSIVLPSPPEDLREIGKSATAVALDWEDLNEYDRDIIIERSLNGTDFTSVGRVDGWDRCEGTGFRGYYVDSGLAPATTYTYRIKTKNDAGESAPTSTIAVTTLASCPLTLPENRSWSAINSGLEDYALLGAAVPVAIKHLGGGKYQISDLSLSLTGSAEPATFYVSCGETLVGSADEINPNGNGTWNGTTTLELKWRACDDNKTETIRLTLSAADPEPEKPAGVLGYVLTNTSIEIKWTPGFYEDTYVVERSLSPGSGYAEIATVDFPAESYIDNGPLTEGITYYYRLRSFNGNTSPLPSVYSDVVTVPFRKPNFVVADNAITQYNQTATLGSIWADFDNDGDEDYFTTQLDDVNEVAKPLIVKNLGGGNFEPMLVAVGDNPYFWPSIVDVDNDHFPDLVLNGDGNRLLDVFKGNGDFTFTKIPSGQLGDLAVIQKAITATSWADVNNDGLPDLMTLHDEDGSFTLYKQNADHSFTEIETGEATNDEPLLAIWSDYDNDGDQDVLVAGEGGLYRNNGDESFTRMLGAGIDDTEYFAAAWGDYDNDGDMDLFIGGPAENALYNNNGDGTFNKDVSTSLSEPNFSVSASWGDFNNDGYLDLMTVGFGFAQSRLFIRDPSVTGSVSFRKIITEKINDLSVSHYSVAHADPEHNGQLDLAMSAFVFDDATDGIGPANNNFYRNNNTLANWSEVKLVPKTGSTESLGAKIKLTAGGMTQMREITAASSLASRNSIIAHFGLGSAASITNIEITWPGGAVQNYANPPINELLIIDEDFAAPSITFTPPADTPKGANLTLQIPVTDDNMVNSVTVFARKISAGDYAEIAATKGAGNNWEAVLDQTTHFDAMGTEYYIEATDNAGNSARSPADVALAHVTHLKYAEADASIPTERLSFGGAVTNWRIIAMPFALTTANNKVQDVFDEFSALRERVDYRIITYINSTAWLDVKKTDALERGRGYFINIINPLSDIGAGDNINAPANSRKNLHKINLSQGWNMIGNPYLTQVSWVDVVAANPELTGSAAELKKYDGATYTAQTQTLDPFEGAFVFVDSAIPDVAIPFLGQGSSGGRKKGFASLGTDISQDAWALKLNVTQGGAVYELSSVGMAPDANASFDFYDDVTPPRFFNYLEVNFEHPEHFAKRFTRDIVPTQPDYSWDFTVDSNQEGTAELGWANAPLLTSGKDIFLLDIGEQKLVNMKETGKYVFDPKASASFRIFYGDNLTIAPERVHLGKAYPNPAKGQTTIPFSLPETGGLNQHVAIDILDALGRTVGTVREGQFNPGYHETAFEATEMQNGFYTYRLTVKNRQGQTTTANKLIIK